MQSQNVNESADTSMAAEALGFRTRLRKVDGQPGGLLAQVCAVVGRRRRRGPGPPIRQRQLRALGLWDVVTTRVHSWYVSL
jgi:hypothetical protein